MDSKQELDDQVICVNVLDKFWVDYSDFFDSQQTYDVTFIFDKKEKDGLAESEEKNEKVENQVRAHKIILAGQSLVFKTMFFGSMPEKDEIKINDISFEIFYSMLRYVLFGDFHYKNR